VRKVAVKTRSAKAKGRRLQNLVAQRIREVFGASELDVKPQLMGGTGVDIQLSSDMAKRFPFSVECKNQESLNIWAALKQASDNAVESTAPVVVFTRNREGKTYIALELEEFLRWVKQ
jgi:hypothetical protein